MSDVNTKVEAAAKRLAGSSEKWVSVSDSSTTAMFISWWTRFWANEDRATGTCLLMLFAALGAAIGVGCTVGSALDSLSGVFLVLVSLGAGILTLGALGAGIFRICQGFFDLALSRKELRAKETAAAVICAQQAYSALAKERLVSRSLVREVRSQLQAIQKMARLEGELSRQIETLVKTAGSQSLTDPVSGLPRDLAEDASAEATMLLAERAAVIREAAYAAAVVAELSRMEVADAQERQRVATELKRQQAAEKVVAARKESLTLRRPTLDVSSSVRRLAELEAEKDARRLLKED